MGSEQNLPGENFVPISVHFYQEKPNLALAASSKVISNPIFINILYL